MSYKKTVTPVQSVLNNSTFIVFFRVISSACYLSIMLVLVACGGSSQGSDIEPITPLPSPDEIRRYAVGDVVDFAGTLSVLQSDSASTEFPIEVRLAFLPGVRTYLDKDVLLMRTSVFFNETGGEQVFEQSIWQESDGALFELTDVYGNVYVNDTTSQQGLIALPTPYDSVMSTETDIDFHTEYGGHVSGAVTTGVRTIKRGSMETLETPLGPQLSYQVNHRESYQYQFTYVDYERDATIAIERTQWIAPTKGQIKKLEIRSEYGPSGALRAVYRWDLELQDINF